MPQTVYVEGFGEIDFPDEYSGEQIHTILKEKFPPPPVTTGEAIKSAAGSALQGAAQTVASVPKSLAAVGMFLEPGLTGQPVNRKLFEDPLYRAGQAVETTAAELLPEDPRLQDSFWLHDVPAGVGNMATMIGTGGVAGIGAKAIGKAVIPAMTRAAIGIGGAAEFNDAYGRALEQGDDPNTAFAKSLGYATVAMAIENRWGAGRILKKYFPDAGTMANKLTGMGVAKEIVKDAVVNFGEEASQRAAQDLIVEGRLNPKAILREGAVGAVIGPLAGAPHNLSRYASGTTVDRARILPSATREVSDMEETSAPLKEEDFLTNEGTLDLSRVPTTTEPVDNTLAEAYVKELDEKIAAATKAKESELSAKQTQADLQSAAAEALDKQAPPESKPEPVPPVTPKPVEQMTPKAPAPAEPVNANPAEPAAPAEAAAPQVMFRQGDRVKMGNIEGTLAIYDDGRVAIRTDKGSEFPAVISKLEAVKPAAPLTDKKRTQAMVDLVDTIIDHYPKIRPPRDSKSDFKEAFNQAATGRLRGVLTMNQGEPIDSVLKGLHEQGLARNIETVDELIEYMGRNANRPKAQSKTAESEHYKALVEKEQGFKSIALDNEGRNAVQKRQSKPISAATLEVGDKFTLNGEKFTVTEISEDGTITVQDGSKFGTQTLDADATFYPDKGHVTTPVENGEVSFLEGDELLPPSEQPFNLVGEKTEYVKPSETTTQHGGETLVQRDLFAIEKIASEVDPQKSADAAQRMYGGAKEAADKIRKQLATIDSDPKVAKTFDKSQRARLKEVIALLEQQSDTQQSRTTEAEGMPVDKIEAALNKAIEATKFDPTKLQEGVTGAPVWMTKAAVNLALKVAKAVYIATRDLAKAIAAGLKELESHKLEGYNEDEARKWMETKVEELSSEQSGELPNYIGEPSDIKQTTTMRGVREANPGMLNEPQLYYPVKSDNLKAEANKVVDSFNGDLNKAFLVASTPEYYRESTDVLQPIVMGEIMERANREKNFAILDLVTDWMDKNGSKFGQLLWTLNALRQRLDPTYEAHRVRRKMLEANEAVSSPHVPQGTVQGVVGDASRVAAKKIDAKKLLKDEMAAQGDTIRTIMEQHAEAQNQTRKDLFNRIKAKFPELSAKELVGLTNKLQDAFEKLRNVELKRMFAQIAQAGGRDITKTGGQALKNAAPKLIRLLNTGAMSDESIWNALAPQFGLPEFTQEIYDELHKRAQEMQKAPEGLPRQQRYADLLNYAVKAQGLSKWDILQSYWYGSVLSGTGTQTTNFVSAIINVQIHNALMAATNPAQAAGILNAAWRGWKVGLLEAGAIVKRGDFSNRITNEITRASGALENIGPESGLLTRLASSLKYVSRLMAFADTMNANSAVEARAYLLAAQKASRELSGKPVTAAEMKEQIEKHLGARPQDIQEAQAQAEREAQEGVIKPEDIKRRAIDIQRKLRPADIVDESISYGRKTTYNNEMEGVLGQIGRSIMQAREHWGVASIPLRIIMPFVQTPVNVANEMLNWTPLGWWRFAKQNPTFREWVSHTPVGKRILSNTEMMNPNDYQILRAKAFLTATGAMALGLLLADDDKDAPIDVEGGWYGLTPEQKRQLMAQGKRPWSLKIGNKYFDFKSWPAAFLLGYFGNIKDQRKYLKDKVSADDYAVNFLKTGYMATDMTFLNGLNSVLELATKRNTTEAESALKKLVSYQGTSLVPNLAKEADTWIMPEQQAPKNWTESMMSQIPVVRSMIGRPAVNALGEVIINRRTLVDRIYQEKVESPLWQALAEKANQGVFIPVPSASAKVLKNGKREKMTADEFYKYQAEAGRLYKQRLTQDIERFKKMTPEQAKDYFEAVLSPLRERARDSVR